MQTRKNKQRWGPWSSWTWDEDRERYYRARQDVDGHIDYEWESLEHPPDDAATARSRKGSNRGVPAYRDDEYGEEISQGLANVHLKSDDGGGRSLEYTTRAPETMYRQSQEPQSQQSGRVERPGRPSHQPRESQSQYSGRAERSSRSSHHSRSHRRDDNIEPVSSSRELTLAKGMVDNYPIPLPSSRDQYAQGYGVSSRDERYDRRGSESQYSQDRIDEELRLAQEQSRQYHYSANGAPYDYDGATDPGGPSTETNDYEPFEDDDGGRSTPKVREKNLDIAEGFMKGLEKLDPRYKVEHSNRFQPGDIFKAYWAEPSGQNKDASTVTSQHQVKTKYGKFWVGFRRFIVIANDEGNCTCLPILTYSGRGCNKKGVKESKHGIIHQIGKKPRRLDGEPPLGLPPIAARMTVEGEKLAQASRINYAKLNTIEHNTPVFFIGYIVDDDFELLKEGQIKIWNEKEMRRRQGGHSHSHRRT